MGGLKKRTSANNHQKSRVLNCLIPKLKVLEVHVGLENVQARLKLMCNASLTIHSEENAGTSVTIRIPKQKRHNLHGVSEAEQSRSV